MSFYENLFLENFFYSNLSYEKLFFVNPSYEKPLSYTTLNSDFLCNGNH